MHLLGQNMKFEWQYQDAEGCVLRNFLRRHKLSRSQLTKIKFAGGTILVNGQEAHTNAQLVQNDVVTVYLAPEVAVEHVIPVKGDLKVVFEDDHFLVVDKPAFVASLPAPNHPHNTMANFVKQYLIDQNAESQAVHVVTRLDRDTSGLMMFTKHGFAHSLLDKQLQSKELQKTYVAIASGDMRVDYPQHAWIDRPIKRSDDFYMRRVVGVGGKRSLTEYWQEAHGTDATLVKLKLLTGRTHQIRVHFASLGHPLIGDNLYGVADNLLPRQALHCRELTFYHPFEERYVTVQSELPADFQAVMDQRHLAFPAGELNKI